ncbi:MAG: DUF2165 family protein [Pseudomonadota bacterium]
MFENALLIAQLGATGFVAGWLTLGLRDNLLYPSVNETYTAEVLSMARMQAEYPTEFAQVAHRAVTDRNRQRLAFRLVVAAETAACVLLWLGVGALFMVFFGAVPMNFAQAIALLGALAFTSIWAGFLVVGNHFCYWFCHESAQNTHYQMTLWGLGTMILLAQA